MASIGPIFEAVEFAERHLKVDIGVADMADAAAYSLYHFCRVFNQVVHHSPYDYLIRRRLSESARELVETDRRIIDIALDYQFGSPESYSRAFKRMFDRQPRQWRRRGTADRRSLMPRLTRDHLAHRNRGDFSRPVIEERDALHLAGLATLFGSERTPPFHLWDLLAAEVGRISVAQGRYYGLVTYPRNWQRHGPLYMAAVEAGSRDLASSVLVTKVVPACRYARFMHKGPMTDLHLTLDYAYHTWLPGSGHRLAYPLEVERYAHLPHPSTDLESEIEILLPIR